MNGDNTREARMLPGQPRPSRIPGASRDDQPKAWKRKVLDGGVFLLAILLLTLIHSPVVFLPRALPDAGDVATHNVKADRDLLIEDPESTNQRRAQAAEQAPPVYDFDPAMTARILDHWREGLAWLEKMRVENPTAPHAQLFEEFSKRLESPLAPDAFAVLMEGADSGKSFAEASHLDTVNKWLVELSEHRVVSGPEVLRDLNNRRYVLRLITNKNESTMSGSTGVVDLSTMRTVLAEAASRHLGDLPKPLARWLLSHAGRQLRPNLVLNIAETEERKKQAVALVELVYFRVQKGEMIVREGEVVSNAARLKMEHLRQSGHSREALLRLTGLALILALLFWLGRRFLLSTSRAFPRDRKTLYTLGTIMVVVSLLSSTIEVAGQGAAEVFGWPMQTVEYLPPVALGAGLVSLIIGAQVALPGGSLLVGAALSFLAALPTTGGLVLFSYYFIGSLVASFALRTSRHRSDIFKAGAWVGLFQMAAVPLVESLAGQPPTLEWLLFMSMGFTSGILFTLFAMALIPMLEWLFDITTDSRLLELASGDHPLLKQLSLRAPGTHHHSVMMGNLAENAAEAVGANPLTARVMALYHDIGKLDKPQYFVENQPGENRHDQLSPSMSAKVIMDHIKQGVDMARKHRLGGPILEAITEHQGTTLLQFFYNKAVIEAEPRGETVSEEDYRYPGPKPHTPESGIIMLADSVEAAARTLKSPSPSQIHSIVRRIINAKIKDGQLDECSLTLQQLARIEEAFTRVLTLGFYHHRIEYPDQQHSRRENRKSGS